MKAIHVSFNGFDFNEVDINYIKSNSEVYQLINSPPIPLGDNRNLPPLVPIGSLIALSRNLVCNGR